VTAKPASGRGLQVTRASYGAALVLAPGLLALLATGRVPGRPERRVARVLGARHLAQALLTAAAPRPEVFALGAQVDALHAASMLALAAVDGRARRAALTDALAEAVFAAAGLSASVEPPEGDLVHQQPERGGHGDRHQRADDAHERPADQYRDH
jgi:hypothetical protein